jgi:hypothetical protein
MTDDKGNRGPADRSRINMDEDYEVDYWTHALGVSKEQLAAAVGAVGPMADAVKRYLKVG